MNCNNRMIRIAPIPQGAKLICGERFRKVSTVGSMATAERNGPLCVTGSCLRNVDRSISRQSIRQVTGAHGVPGAGRMPLSAPSGSFKRKVC